MSLIEYCGGNYKQRAHSALREVRSQQD